MAYCISGLPVFPDLLVQPNQLDATVFCPAGWRIVAFNPLSFAITLTSPDALHDEPEAGYFRESTGNCLLFFINIHERGNCHHQGEQYKERREYDQSLSHAYTEQ
jgi:hypothetical protein